MDVSVRTLAADESRLIGRIIADGFHDDPVNLWAFNGTGAMQPVFTAMARHLYLKKGFGHCSSDGLAGTLWLPPGAKKTYGLGNLSMARDILFHGGFIGVKHSLAIDAFMARRRAGLAAHFYLFAIAVHPGLQGRGIGAKLMKQALEQVDRDNMPAYLENSKARNTPFYERYGFEVMEEIRPAPDCPPMWLMWRQPRG